jgi:outer membrane protein assembly factor BamB
MGGTTLFVGGKDRVAAFNSADCTALWSVLVDGDVYSMAIAGGRLFASTSKGSVYCYE